MILEMKNIMKNIIDFTRILANENITLILQKIKNCVKLRT